MISWLAIFQQRIPCSAYKHVWDIAQRHLKVTCCGPRGSNSSERLGFSTHWEEQTGGEETVIGPGWLAHIETQDKGQKNWCKKNSAFQSQSASNKGFHRWRIYPPIPYQLGKSSLGRLWKGWKNLSSLSDLHSLQAKPMRKSKTADQEFTSPYPSIPSIHWVQPAKSGWVCSEQLCSSFRLQEGSARNTEEIHGLPLSILMWCSETETEVTGLQRDLPSPGGTKSVFHGQGNTAPQRSW